MIFSFRVQSTPVPQGSHKMGLNRKTGRHYIIDDNGAALKQWRRDVGLMAKAAASKAGLRGPVAGVPCDVMMHFHLATPETQKPDVDKLARAVLDALKGIVYKDDSQVRALQAQKFWNGQTGMDAPSLSATVAVLT